MKEKMQAYGVFLEEEWGDTLIYSDVMSYAIYEKQELAVEFKRDMNDRWAGTGTVYIVKPMCMEVDEDE